MTVKRKGPQVGSNSTRMNFRLNSPETSKWETKGTRPLPEPSSIANVLLMMLLHICRRLVFVDTRKRAVVYCGTLFLISLIGDTMPIPRSYFSRTDNALNLYFVKFGWGWTMLVTFPFLVFTSFTINCGRRDKVIKHFLRLCIATCMWLFWTKLFSYIEITYGKCSIKGDFLKRECLEKGHFWYSFDISGHTFILMYSTLIMIEEGRPIIGWERIRDFLRDEHHCRSSPEEIKQTSSSSPLSSLTDEDLIILKSSYEKFTPFVRGFFILMTCLTVLWDFMLFFTMLYFHNMVEKLVGGFIAICVWLITYHVWYKMPNVMPDLPGEGLFKYKERQNVEVPLAKKRKSIASNTPRGQVPKFMGMPLYSLRSQDDKRDSSSNGNTTTQE